MMNGNLGSLLTFYNIVLAENITIAGNDYGGYTANADIYDNLTPIGIIGIVMSGGNNGNIIARAYLGTNKYAVCNIYNSNTARLTNINIAVNVLYKKNV